MTKKISVELVTGEKPALASDRIVGRDGRTSVWRDKPDSTWFAIEDNSAYDPGAILVEPDEVEALVRAILDTHAEGGGDAAQIVRRLALRLDTETPWRDDDLMLLGEADREMGLVNRLPKIASLQRRGERTYTPPFPDPVIEGRTAKLYSLSELKTWWAAYKA